MVKYALILAFSYPRTHSTERINLQYLSSTSHDIQMIYNLCKSFDIEDRSITVVTDIVRLPSEVYNCNLKCNPYPSDVFVCREICQFLENTIRGIEELTYKSDTDYPEVLLYISGHGAHINIEDNLEQGIVLYSDDGSQLKYLLSKDIFNIIFGNLPIESDGTMEIPVWGALKRHKRVETQSEIRYVPENIGTLIPITVKLSPTVASPSNSPDMITKPYRSTYLANRGIPLSTRMLIIIDTCYSEHMTYFPYIYDHRSQNMNETSNSNIEVSSILPYCVAISSCEFDKKTVAKSCGSSLTRILYMKILKLKTRLNISQLHYIIYNSNNGIINDLLRTESSHPIITSTHPLSNLDIPFFSSYTPTVPIKIFK